MPLVPMVALAHVLWAAAAFGVSSSSQPSTAVARCYFDAWGHPPAAENPKVLAVGGRAGHHVDLIVFMRSDGSVVSCACCA